MKLNITKLYQTKRIFLIGKLQLEGNHQVYNWSAHPPGLVLNRATLITLNYLTPPWQHCIIHAPHGHSCALGSVLDFDTIIT